MPRSIDGAEVAAVRTTPDQKVSEGRFPTVPAPTFMRV